MFGSISTGAAAQGPPNPPPGLHNGQAALDALGERLPEVAKAYGLRSAELRDLFLSDHTLYVDGNDELLVMDDPFLWDDEASQAEQSGG